MNTAVRRYFFGVAESGIVYLSGIPGQGLEEALAQAEKDGVRHMEPVEEREFSVYIQARQMGLPDKTAELDGIMARRFLALYEQKDALLPPTRAFHAEEREEIRAGSHRYDGGSGGKIRFPGKGEAEQAEEQ